MNIGHCDGCNSFQSQFVLKRNDRPFVGKLLIHLSVRELPSNSLFQNMLCHSLLYIPREKTLSQISKEKRMRSSTILKIQQSDLCITSLLFDHRVTNLDSLYSMILWYSKRLKRETIIGSFAWNKFIYSEYMLYSWCCSLFEQHHARFESALSTTCLLHSITNKELSLRTVASCIMYLSLKNYECIKNTILFFLKLYSIFISRSTILIIMSPTIIWHTMVHIIAWIIATLINLKYCFVDIFNTILMRDIPDDLLLFKKSIILKHSTNFIIIIFILLFDKFVLVNGTNHPNGISDNYSNIPAAVYGVSSTLLTVRSLSKQQQKRYFAQKARNRRANHKASGRSERFKQNISYQNKRKSTNQEVSCTFRIVFHIRHYICIRYYF